MTSSPPNFSASVTTPSRSDSHDCDPAHSDAVARDAVQPDDFRRAAADVEQHDRLGLAVDEFAAAGDRQRRLGLAVDDLQLEVEPFVHPLEEFDAVFRRPARFGGDQPRPRHAARRHLVAADLQRLERALDRRLAEPTALRQALAKTHDAREGVDDAKSVRCRTGHQQAAIIRAQIQRGVGTARRAAIARRPPEARLAIPGARRIRAQLRVSQKQLPAPWRGKRPGRGFVGDCSKTRPGCNATQRPGGAGVRV